MISLSSAAGGWGGGRGVLPRKSLIGMGGDGPHFHTQIDYHRVTLLIELKDIFRIFEDRKFWKILVRRDLEIKKIKFLIKRLLPPGSQQLHWSKNDQYWIYNWPQNRLYCRRGSERPAAHLTKIDPSTPTQCFIHFFLYPSKSFEKVANECYWHLKVKKCNPNSFI